MVYRRTYLLTRIFELGPAEEYETSPKPKKPYRTEYFFVEGFKGPIPVFTFSYCSKCNQHHVITSRMDVYKMDTVHLEKLLNCTITPATSNTAVPIPRQVVTPEVAPAAETNQDLLAITQPVKSEQEVEEKISMIKEEIEILSSTLPSGDDTKHDNMITTTTDPDEMTTEELENEAKELRRRELIEQVKQLRVSLLCCYFSSDVN